MRSVHPRITCSKVRLIADPGEPREQSLLGNPPGWIDLLFFVYFSVHRTKGARKTNVGLGHPGQVTPLEGKAEYWRQMGSDRQRGGETVCYCCRVCSNGEAGERLRPRRKSAAETRVKPDEGSSDPGHLDGFSYWGAALWPSQRPRILTTRPLLLHSARREEQMKDDGVRKRLRTNGVKRRKNGFAFLAQVLLIWWLFCGLLYAQDNSLKRFVLLNHK